MAVVDAPSVIPAEAGMMPSTWPRLMHLLSFPRMRESGSRVPATPGLGKGRSDRLRDRRPPLLAAPNPPVPVLRIVVGRRCGRDAVDRGLQRIEVQGRKGASRTVRVCADVHPATPAHQEFRGLQPESVTVQRIRIDRRELHRTGRIAGAAGRMAAAERALAGPYRPLRRCERGAVLPFYRSAVAASFVCFVHGVRSVLPDAGSRRRPGRGVAADATRAAQRSMPVPGA